MQKNSTQLSRELDNQRAVNKIMWLSLSDESLAEILNQTLRIISLVPWLQILPMGAIFIKEKNNDVLVLTASRELDFRALSTCARVTFDQCLCGKAAKSKKIQFASGPDDLQISCFDGVKSFGHHCSMPLLDENQDVLGVLNLSFKPEHQQQELATDFLLNVCDVLVAVIRQKQVETNLCAATATIEASQIELATHLEALGNHAIAAITDTSGTITYANDKFSQISGYSLEELIGKNHNLLKSGYHPDSFFTDMYKTLANGGHWHGEIKNRAKNGSNYWVDTTISPFRDANGKICQYLAIRSDITSRKIAEEVLKRNMEILNTTFNNFPGGISVFTKELFLQAANPAFYKLLDLPEEMFPVGVPLEDITRYKAERGEYGEGDVDEIVQGRIELAMKFEKHRFKKAGPRGRSIEIEGWPLPEGGFITTYMDITEAENMLVALEEKSNEAVAIAEDLRQAKEDQEQAHKHLVTSVNSMRNGFAIWDSNDELVLANDAFLNFHDPIRKMIVKGVKFEEMIMAGLDIGNWDQKGQSKEEWLRQRMLNRRQSSRSEREVEFADGKQVVISDLALDNGDVITTVIDITAHRQRELELQDAKDRLENIAYYDSLTGLANRAHCQMDMAEKFAFVDSDKKFAIIQIDLDNFKRVNDTLGHAAGDHLLKTLGERMSLLASDFKNFKSYRWGGDEFIALVERDDDTDLDAICSELTDMISIPLSYGKSTLRPTVSLGVARYPEDAQDLESLMIFSDLALYRTKELGRDGYQFFTSEMKDKIDTESRIEQELRIAIEKDQLELYFQPQVDIADETITGLEALIRWNHPEKGLIGPGEFLSISEGTGLAPAIGCKVFDYAMTAVRYWVDEGLEFGRLAVNLSPEHLKRGTILDDFLGMMKKYDIESQFLAVEFLESFIFDDPNANITDILQQFRARDIHVELDDFGTGYASLSHLSTMPITGLKIDKSFVDQMTNDKRQQGIISALISISKLMKLRVVCEGIETWEQVDAISQIGKCSIQGYFVARPMNFKDITRWIKNEGNKGVLKAWSGLAKDKL